MLVFVNYLKIGTILKVFENYKAIYIYIMMGIEKEDQGPFVFVVRKFFFKKNYLKLIFYVFISLLYADIQNKLKKLF